MSVPIRDGGTVASAPADTTRLSDITSHQWKSGIAAWLGWLFDGLDMHLYTLVAVPFVAELLHIVDTKDPQVSYYSSWIQAAFLIGWALGGGFFGIIGDRLGRTRALVLTILTYAAFTGLSYFAQTWWHLLIFRFMAALGIGGEWAVGASLISESWPKKWRPWLAGILQSGVNFGVLLASLAVYLLASFPHRSVFLVGVLPALLVLWIRKAVPEPEEWHAARAESGTRTPPFSDLFRGEVRKITVLTLIVCALGLTAHWAFMFWFAQHLRNLPDVQAMTDAARSEVTTAAMSRLMIGSIIGNFAAAALARWFGYRKSIVFLFLMYLAMLVGAYGMDHDYKQLMLWMVPLGICQGVFGLFTMYMPPLFPTLLRTTGAGFCYNIGRIAAALGTVVFGLFNKVGNFQVALLAAGTLFIPAAAAACLLPEPPDERPATVIEPMPVD